MALILAAIVALIVLAGIHPGRDERKRLAQRAPDPRARRTMTSLGGARSNRMAVTLGQPKRTPAHWWLS